MFCTSTKNQTFYTLLCIKLRDVLWGDRITRMLVVVKKNRGVLCGKRGTLDGTCGNKSLKSVW